MHSLTISHNEYHYYSRSKRGHFIITFLYDMHFIMSVVSAGKCSGFPGVTELCCRAGIKSGCPMICGCIFKFVLFVRSLCCTQLNGVRLLFRLLFVRKIMGVHANEFVCMIYIFIIKFYNI